MAKQKNQLRQNAGPRMDQIRGEHRLLGLQLWQRGKYRRGNAVKPAVTLASQALKVELRERDVARWLNKEVRVILKFYRPLWWLNPVKWFKAHEMRKRRDLCTYIVTASHMSVMSSKWSKPVTLLTTGWFLRPLLQLTKRVSRWFQRLNKREEFRECVTTFRNEEAKRRRAERLRKQDVQRQIRECDERTAIIRQRMAKSEEKHRKAMEASAQERAERKGPHEEYMSEWDKRIEQKQKSHEERMSEWDKRIEQKERSHEEYMSEWDKRIEQKERSHEEYMSEWDKRIEQKEKSHEECMNEWDKKIEQKQMAHEKEMREWDIKHKQNRQAYEKQMQKIHEKSVQQSEKMREIQSISPRRLQELQPTIARLKAMMAAVWICQVSGKSTIARMAAVIAEHDRIAERNGLSREGFDKYYYHVFKDTRRYGGVEPEDRAASVEDDLRIRKASGRDVIRI